MVMKASGGVLSVGQLSDQLGLDPLLVGYTIARFRALGLINFIAPDEVAVAAPGIRSRPSQAPAQVPTASPAEAKPRYWRGRLVK